MVIGPYLQEQHLYTINHKMENILKSYAIFKKSTPRYQRLHKSIRQKQERFLTLKIKKAIYCDICGYLKTQELFYME